MYMLFIPSIHFYKETLPRPVPHRKSLGLRLWEYVEHSQLVPRFDGRKGWPTSSPSMKRKPPT